MAAYQRLRPIIATPGSPPIAAVGVSLVVREWTLPGPSYLHVHNQDDEAWHVLAGSLRFIFADGEVDAPAGTTVFVPAGLPHTYRAPEGARYLIILTPKIDRLIGRLLDPDHPDDVRATLGVFDTEVFELPVEQDPHRNLGPYRSTPATGPAELGDAYRLAHVKKESCDVVHL